MNRQIKVIHDYVVIQDKIKPEIVFLIPNSEINNVGGQVLSIINKNYYKLTLVKSNFKNTMLTDEADY